MKNKKAGIITFHDSRNYGAVLQAYALQQKMLEIFSDIEIIDYQNEKIADVLKLWDPKGHGLKSYIRASLGAAFRYRKKKAFDKYLKKYIRLSERVDRQNIESYADGYDVLITGSDQVWNTELTGSDKTYFLDFAKENQCRVSYAASFGDKKVELDKNLQSEISKFDIVTLRENVMFDDVERIAAGKTAICCDPCLLLSSEQWKQHASKRFSAKPYIFLFVIDESAELTNYAKSLSAEKGLPLISNKNDFSFFLNPLPNDFLSWVLNAEYIVTNSFHGTVFSLLFHKKFISYVHTASGEPKKRIVELLNKTGMPHRTTDNKSLIVDQNEDWKSVDGKISEIRNSSWNNIKYGFEQYYGG